MNGPTTDSEADRICGPAVVTPAATDPLAMHPHPRLVWFRDECRRLSALAEACLPSAASDLEWNALRDVANGLHDNAGDLSGAIDAGDEDHARRLLSASPGGSLRHGNGE